MTDEKEKEIISEFKTGGTISTNPCEDCHAIGKPDMKQICSQCPHQHG